MLEKDLQWLEKAAEEFQDDGETSGVGKLTEQLIEEHRRLRKAVIGVISIDRMLGGTENEDHARRVELQPGDSVMVADLLRGLGVPVGDYP